MSSYNLTQRIQGCIIGAAIGDALGAPFESMSKKQVKKYCSNGVGYIAPPAEYWSERGPTQERHKMKPGSYTDDTQATIAVIESLIESKGFDGNDMAEKLASIKDYRFGGKTSRRAFDFFQYLKDYEQSGSFNSVTDGSAMRVHPIGIFYSSRRDVLVNFSMESSNITHRSPIARAACRTVALLTSYALHEQFDGIDLGYMLRIGERNSSEKKFNDKLSEAFENIRTNPVKFSTDKYSYNVTDIVPEAIQCFLHTPKDFKKTLTNAVLSGGDTDTRASITGAFSGAFNGIDAIPQEWKNGLENYEMLIELSRLLEESAIKSGFLHKEEFRRVPIEDPNTSQKKRNVA